MGLEANVGDRRFYHEAGMVIEVDVLAIREKNMGKNNPGEEYELRTIRVAQQSSILTDEAHPKIGETFSVCRSKTNGAYAGWSLLNTV